MELTAAVLVQTEWVSQGAVTIRLKFRRDGTGYYDREGGPRLIHENYLYRLEGDRLHLKFAHARLWTDAGVLLQKGHGAEGARMAVRVLVLSHDPYAATLEEKATGELILASDAGGALPG